jgi:DNA primase
MDSTAYDRLIDALREYGGTVTTNGNGVATAQCPAHDDHNPSLKVTEGAGNVLVHCFAGCDTKDVLAELNMTQADLFDAKGGVSYSYRDGRVVKRTPDKQFRQTGNTKGTSLFQAEDIGGAETVYVTEGEKDAANLTHAYGVAAVSPPCGAGTAAEKWHWTPLSGKHVIVVADKDGTGRKHAEDVAAPCSP